MPPTNPFFPATLATFTMVPRRRSRIPGSTRRVNRKSERTLVAMVASHSVERELLDPFPDQYPGVVDQHVHRRRARAPTSRTTASASASTPTSPGRPAASIPAARSSVDERIELRCGAGADAHAVAGAPERERGGAADPFGGPGDEGGFDALRAMSSRV